MPQKTVLTRGRVTSILVAGGIGYLLGGWNITALRSSTELSASQTVALRFPLELDDRSAAVPVPAVLEAPVAASSLPANVMPANGLPISAQLALWSPQPMVPPSLVPQATAPRTPVQTADAAAPSHTPDAAPALRPQPVAAALPPRDIKRIAAAAVHRHDERSGFVLNDAQIASIKDRLRLSPDQERMWPAVEAALRNLAYNRVREAQRRGVAASAAQLASADPDSTDVQDLKSAAIPLIMSFNPEQKDEVRSLAHVMGLDQLASQF